MYSGKSRGLYVKTMYRKNDNLPYFKIAGDIRKYDYVVFMELYTSLMNTVKSKFAGSEAPNVKISEHISRVHKERLDVNVKRFTDAKKCLRDAITLAGLSNPYSDSVFTDEKNDKIYIVNPFLVDSEFIDKEDIYKIPMYKLDKNGNKKLIYKLATINLMERLSSHFILKIGESN